LIKTNNRKSIKKKKRSEKKENTLKQGCAGKGRHK